MLALSPDAASKELLEKIPYPIKVKEFLTGVLCMYPVKLKQFTFVNQENGVEVIGCPFNPPIVPIESTVMQALMAQNKEHLVGQTQNKFGEMIIENLRKASELIRGELGCSFEEFLEKDVKFIKKKGEGIIIASSLDANNPALSGDGDELLVGIDVRQSGLLL